MSKYCKFHVFQRNTLFGEVVIYLNSFNSLKEAEVYVSKYVKNNRSLWDRLMYEELDLLIEEDVYLVYNIFGTRMQPLEKYSKLSDAKKRVNKLNNHTSSFGKNFKIMGSETDN